MEQKRCCCLIFKAMSKSLLRGLEENVREKNIFFFHKDLSSPDESLLLLAHRENEGKQK